MNALVLAAARRSARWAARWGLFLFAAMAGCAVDPPAAFGVNVKVSARGLDPALRAQITQLELRVSGDELYQRRVDVGETITSGEVRVRYIPAIRQGTLSFDVGALEAAGAVLARGASPGVALAELRSVDVDIELSSEGVDAADLGLPVDLGASADLEPPADLLPPTTD